jgi:uncharacterized protein YdcH (DUF465 family)
MSVSVRRRAAKARDEQVGQETPGGIAVSPSSPARGQLDEILRELETAVKSAEGVQYITAEGVKITDIDELSDRLFLVGPPGVGKTEHIKRLAFREAVNLGRVFVDLRLRVVDPREGSIYVGIKPSPECEHYIQTIEHIPIEELLKDEKCAQRVSVRDIIRNPEKYYLFQRIIAPHMTPEDLGSVERARIPLGDGGVEDFRYSVQIPTETLALMSLNGVRGTLFIDELTNLERTDQIAMYYSLILEKEAGLGVKLSNGVKVVAAGNPPEYSRIARRLPLPLLNRMKIVHIKAPNEISDVKKWIEYMNRYYKDRWLDLCGIYLTMYPSELSQPPKEDQAMGKIDGFPTPRTWTMACIELKRIYDDLVKVTDRIVELEKKGGSEEELKKLREERARLQRALVTTAKGYLGGKTGGMLAYTIINYSFREAMRKLIDFLMKNPDAVKELVHKSIEVRIAVIYAIVQTISMLAREDRRRAIELLDRIRSVDEELSKGVSNILQEFYPEEWRMLKQRLYL